MSHGEVDPNGVAGAVTVGEDLKGCGFLIAAQLAITANHLVRRPDGSSVEPDRVGLKIDGTPFTVRAIESDLDLDVAVLHLVESAVEWLQTGHARKGQDWKVRTQPRGNDPQLNGIFSALRRPYTNSWGRKTLGHQVQVNQVLDDYRGYSGSPVEAPDGVVVGVMVEQIGSRLPNRSMTKSSAAPVAYVTPIEDVIAKFGLHENATWASPADVDAYLSALTHQFAEDPWTRLAGGMNAVLPELWRNMTMQIANELGGVAEDVRLHADALVDAMDRLVVLGGPGSGKTWFARHTAIRATEQARRRIEGGEQVESVEIPLFARCADVVASRASTWDATVEAALADLGHLFARGQELKALRRRFIDEPGRYLVVLDGLDEAEDLPTADYLRRLVDVSGRKLRIVLTSRANSWRGQLDLTPQPIKSGEPHESIDTSTAERPLRRGVAELQPIDFADVILLAEQAVPDPQRRQNLMDLLDANDGLANASQTPLICVMLCLVANSDNGFPDNIEDLYDRVIVRLLRGTWHGQEHPDRHLEPALVALRKLAWAGVDHDPHSGLGRWQDAIPSRNESSLNDDVRAMLSHVATETGHDPERTGVQRRFVHRSIREHLVAEQIATMSVEEAAEVLKPHLWFDSDWSNVVPTALARHPQRYDLLRRILAVSPDHWASAADLDVRDGFGELWRHLARVAELTTSADWMTDGDELDDDLARIINDVAPLSKAAARGWWRPARQLQAEPKPPSTAASLESELRWYATAELAESYLALTDGPTVPRDLINAVAEQVSGAWSAHQAFDAAAALSALGADDEIRAQTAQQFLARLTATPSDDKDAHNNITLLQGIAILGSDEQRGEALDLMLGRIDEFHGSYLNEQVVAAIEEFLPTEGASAGRALRHVIDKRIEHGPWGDSAHDARRLAVRLSQQANDEDRDLVADRVIARLAEAAAGEITAWAHLLRDWPLRPDQRDRAIETLLARLGNWPDSYIGNMAIALQDLAPSRLAQRDAIVANLVGRLEKTDEIDDPEVRTLTLRICAWASAFAPTGYDRRRIVEELVRAASTAANWNVWMGIALRDAIRSLTLLASERGKLANALEPRLQTWRPSDILSSQTVELVRSLAPDSGTTTRVVATLGGRLFDGQGESFWMSDLLFAIGKLEPSESDLADAAARVYGWAKQAPARDVARWEWGRHLSALLSSEQLRGILDSLLPRLSTELSGYDEWRQVLNFLSNLEPELAHSSAVRGMLIAALETAEIDALNEIAGALVLDQPTAAERHDASQHLLRRITAASGLFNTTLIARALLKFELSGQEKVTVRRRMMGYARDLRVDDIHLLSRFTPGVQELNELLKHHEATRENIVWMREFAEVARRQATLDEWQSSLPNWAGFSQARRSLL